MLAASAIEGVWHHLALPAFLDRPGVFIGTIKLTSHETKQMNNFKHSEDNGNYSFVQFIQGIPCNCIEVRYSGKRLISYAVYGDHCCYISHGTTNSLRKRHGRDLGPMLAIEQKRNPEFPIHIL